MPTYHIENFGCRATQADGGALGREFEQRGLSRATSTAADLVVLNTCTVTAAADQDARAAIRRVQRQNPNAKIVVTGCYAQRAPEEIAALAGVSAVVGNSHKHQLVELALSNFGIRTQFDFRDQSSSGFVPLAALLPPIFVSDIFAHTELMAAPVFEDGSADVSESARTRPILKVQDGCDNRCSFCVIPFVRGNSRSLASSGVLRELEGLIAAGYREVVISGINLGRWGRDLDVSSQPSAVSRVAQQAATRFEDLLRLILSQTSLEKLRISSVEPMDWTDELIRLVAESSRIAKHAHVPLQSGSDAVLRRMHRKYRPWHYREKIEKIREAMPTAAIGADVMVGFPGETDAEFEETRRLIDDLPLTYLHVFTYSARPGTPASALPSQVPVQAARERNRILRELAQEKKQAFMRSFVGTAVDAITLSQRIASSASNESPRASSIVEERLTEALTDNYLKVIVAGHHEPNRWLKAKVRAVSGDALVGSVA